MNLSIARAAYCSLCLLASSGMVLACTASQDLGSRPPSSQVDAATDSGPADASDRQTTEPDAATSDAALPNDPVTLANGVMSRADRIAFCTEVANCKDSIKYTDCLRYATTSAVADFARPGCGATPLLLTAAGCQRAVELCGSNACDAAIDAWWARAKTVLDSGGKCSIGSGELGIGDAFAPLGFGDSMCQGVRAGGGWCTGACSRDSACQGSHASGKNVFGTSNLCGPDTLIGGGGCYPTCTTTAQCVDWYGVNEGGQLRTTTCRKFPQLAAPICVQNTTDGVEQL